MYYCTMEIYSHFVKITKVTEPARQALRAVCSRLMQYEWEQENGRRVKKRGKLFWAMTEDKQEFRFNKNMLGEIKDALELHAIKEHNIETIVHDLYEPVKVSLKLPDTWVARPDQVPLIEYLVAEGHLKTVALRTGGGKTSCSLKAGELIGHRIAITVLGRYCDKWISDVSNNYGTDNNGVLVIRGMTPLCQALCIASMGQLEADVIIITHKGIQEYIAEYERTRFAGMPDYFVPPEYIYQALGVGLRILDEAHQHFHQNFIMDCYTHIPKTIALSATLEPQDKFLNSMYELVYPRNTRMGGGVDKKYVKCTSLRYSIKDHRKVRCTRRGNYNHDVYERWLMKRKESFQSYLNMISSVARKEYYKIRKPGHKLLVFATGVEMCGLVRDHLRKQFPDLTVNKYNSEDDYELLMNSDISVSTIGSAGTAVDIAGLITVILTTAYSSKQGNEQVIGRLREIKDGSGIVPHFIFFTCSDISKHMGYERDKFEALKTRILGKNVLMYDGLI